MATLYELTEEMQQLLYYIEEEPDADWLKDTLEGVDYELELKAEDYCRLIQTLNDKVDNISKEVERLNSIKKTAANGIERLKDRLFYSMETLGKSKIETQFHKLSIRNNPLSIDLLPPTEELPEKYRVKQEDKVDKRLLLADIKAGVEVEGVTLKQTKSLQIK